MKSIFNFRYRNIWYDDFQESYFIFLFFQKNQNEIFLTELNRNQQQFAA